MKHVVKRLSKLDICATVHFSYTLGRTEKFKNDEHLILATKYMLNVVEHGE